MALIKLSYKESYEVDTRIAVAVKDELASDKPNFNKLIKVSDTKWVKLGQIKEVDTSGRLYDNETKEKYDMFRDREMLMKFAREVEIDGGFDAYCKQKQLLILSRSGSGIAVNLDKHEAYTDALMRWDLVRKIWDLSITDDERQEGLAMLYDVLKAKNLLKKKVTV